MANSDEADHDEIRKEFHEAVNMSADELEEWLKIDDSKAVGFKYEDESEAVGHQSGRRIVEIKQKRRADLTADDYKHMHKVVVYVHRHKAQDGPSDNKEHSRWRYSLMNWGHDPPKK